MDDQHRRLAVRLDEDPDDLQFQSTVILADPAILRFPAGSDPYCGLTCADHVGDPGCTDAMLASRLSQLQPHSSIVQRNQDMFNKVCMDSSSARALGEYSRPMTDMSRSGEGPRRRRPIVVAVIGTVVVVAYALLAAVQILVLNPLAAVPGAELSQIYADVAAAGESMGAPLVMAGLAVGPVVAIGLLVRAWRRPDGEARIVAVQYLALVALGAFGYFWASFGPGMALADTYGIGGGDHSPWAKPLQAASGVAFVVFLMQVPGAVSMARALRGGAQRR